MILRCQCGRKPRAMLEMHGEFTDSGGYVVRRNGVNVVLTCPDCGNVTRKLVECDAFVAMTGDEEIIRVVEERVRAIEL